MWETIEAYWPHVLAAVSVTLATTAAIHATMTKTEVRAALGWVGVILLSPIVGALVYFAFGINRMNRKQSGLRRRPSDRRVDAVEIESEAREIAERFGPRLAALCRLGRGVGGMPLRAGNQIELLPNGDETYAAMIGAIATARHSILLESYIFDHDQVGLRIVAALSEAQARGVEVRVLIDAVGVRYSKPTILQALTDEGIRAALFNGRLIVGLRLPYANLRTHRKILVIDDRMALVGGMNIRAGFTQEFAGNTSAHDTHFRVTGPAVADYRAIAAEDWSFATGEALPPLPRDRAEEVAAPAIPVTCPAGGEAEAEVPPKQAETERGTGSQTASPASIGGWSRISPTRSTALPAATALQPLEASPPAAFSMSRTGVRLRVVASGPDARLETAHKLLMGAFSVAERSIRVMSPYFLPDRELVSALNTAARRGVEVDIVTPANSNLTLVDRAMQAQFDQVLRDGCRVWRTDGPFDHSKLLTIDGCWSFVGSSNLDPRSLRLNFEIDSEVFDETFAARIERRIDRAISTALPVTLEELRARPFLERLANRALWLGSPYL